MSTSPALPSLRLADWQPTYATLHMYMQIVGKIRLELTPLINHWWNVTFAVTPRGVTTSTMPWGDGAFEMEFDFLDHALVIRTSDGATRSLPLVPRAVADFHAELMAVLGGLGIEVKIWGTPVEVPDPTPFVEDRRHTSYDPDAAQRFWRILLWSQRVMQEFRARFIGKCSPVHFFWGSFDLAVTRFSGKRAPEREGADAMTREAYSHEVISAGFWPGGGPVAEPAYYCYAAPQPAGFEREPVCPSAAFYHAGLSEFLLPYEAVRSASAPAETLLEFLQSTYEAGARLAGWDRKELERPAAS